MKTRTSYTTLEIVLFSALVMLLSLISAWLYQYARSTNDAYIDTTNAKEMTEILRNDQRDSEIERFDAADMRGIISKTTSIVFKPLQEDMSFWYHIATKTVIVAPEFSHFDPLEITIRNKTGRDYLQEGLSNQDSPSLEEIVSGFILLDTHGSDAANGISIIRNMRKPSEFDHPSSGALSLLAPIGLESHAMRFSPEKTLFINDFFGFSNATEPILEQNIIFADGIEIIPKDALDDVGHLLPDVMRLPASVTVIEEGAFLTLPQETLLLYDDLESIRVENHVFQPSRTLNMDLINRQGSIMLYDLKVHIAFSYSRTKYYIDNVYIGRIERTGTIYDNYYDASHQLIGYFDGTHYYSPEHLRITSGQTYDAIEQLMSSFLNASYVETTYQQTVELTLGIGEDSDMVEVDTFETVYHAANGMVYVFVKGYDLSGKVLAAGNTTYQEPSVLPEANIPSQEE